MCIIKYLAAVLQPINCQMAQHEAHNLEGAKGAYCQVFSMYVYIHIGVGAGPAGPVLAGPLVF